MPRLRWRWPSRIRVRRRSGSGADPCRWEPPRANSRSCRWRSAWAGGWCCSCPTDRRARESAQTRSRRLHEAPAHPRLRDSRFQRPRTIRRWPRWFRTNRRRHWLRPRPPRRRPKRRPFARRWPRVDAGECRRTRCRCTRTRSGPTGHARRRRGQSASRPGSTRCRRTRTYRWRRCSESNRSGGPRRSPAVRPLACRCSRSSRRAPPCSVVDRPLPAWRSASRHRPRPACARTRGPQTRSSPMNPRPACRHASRRRCRRSAGRAAWDGTASACRSTCCPRS